MLSNSYVASNMVSTRLVSLVNLLLKIVLLDSFYSEKVAFANSRHNNNRGKAGTTIAVGGAGILISVYIDLCKACDHLNRAKCLEILTGYGVGPKLLRLQVKFWDQAQMVCCAGGSFGEPFTAFQGVTQGGLLSSLMLMFVLMQ
jgi:hypothetical protein